MTFPVSRIQTEGINSFVVHCFLISCDVFWTSRTWILRVSSLLGSLPFNECIHKLLFTFVRVNNKASSLHLYSGILRIFKSYRTRNTQHQKFPKNRFCCHAHMHTCGKTPNVQNIQVTVWAQKTTCRMPYVFTCKVHAKSFTDIADLNARNQSEPSTHSVNQSINQINQSINPINQSTNRSINQSLNQSIKSINQSNQSINQSIQSISQPINQSITQAPNHSINQSLKHPITQSNNHSVN